MLTLLKLPTQMAVEKKLQIMLPTWLPAVREVWTSAEKVDWDEVRSALAASVARADASYTLR